MNIKKKNINNMKIKYRPEINGIRTIAVFAVIFYHIKLPFLALFFRGGFLGVDIFFVISGYLLTSIILKELETDGKFSFTNFYERRARRILPTLFFVMQLIFHFYFHNLTQKLNLNRCF